MFYTSLLQFNQANLSTGLFIVFIICVIVCIGFEFVNGFHDTANAVATVIYTKALKPQIAVPWSGFCNFLGVLTGGIAVAMGILKLVPLNEIMAQPIASGACLVLAVLVSATFWNLGTWYLGIPCSSSHTTIGSMIGASIGFTYYYGGGVNWSKAGEIGLSLLMSPLFGFGVALLLMIFLKNVVKAKSLFHAPQGEDKPPMYIRILLILTCTLVSFFHGSNDGQKGVGIFMLILICFFPVKYAVDHNVSDVQVTGILNEVKGVVSQLKAANPHSKELLEMENLMNTTAAEYEAHDQDDNKKIFQLRKNILAVSKLSKTISNEKMEGLEAHEKQTLKTASSQLLALVEYAPTWVILIISIALGVGTMIGWKRIAVTIGEKIGKEHLNYAQGATAEIVAAGTIGLSSGLGLPVSTTHVLSSGIAGAMVASNGTQNLNSGTLKNIGLAWLLTLPVTIVLALLLFMLFHLFI
jgi:PiT family inorganic phosphate transporter